MLSLSLNNAALLCCPCSGTPSYPHGGTIYGFSSDTLAGGSPFMQRLSFPPCSATRSTGPLQHSLEAPPTAALSFRRAVEEGSRTGDGGGSAEWEERKERGCDHWRGGCNLLGRTVWKSHDCRVIVVAAAVGRGFSAQCECREGRGLMLGMEGGRQTDRGGR